MGKFPMLEDLRVAIVHYWLVGMRGGEKVVEAILDIFPHADIYTHVYDASAVSARINRNSVRTTFINRLPRATNWYQKYLPLMPLALEQLDLRQYDLVISSESGPAKGVITGPDTIHICYCHSPMRYLWDMYHIYLANAGRATRLFFRPISHYLRVWDVTAAARVDRFITNSAYVARRVRKYYNRDSEVIPPPVDTSEFQPANGHSDYYLFVGHLVDYKRADLAIEACRRTGRRLVVIGEGPGLRELKRLGTDKIEFLGRQPTTSLREHYARCRALIFPGIEDFGIVPVECMASGRPVIAFRSGGALETVNEGVTGLFFDEQSPDSVIAAIERFESMADSFSPQTISAHALRFSREAFIDRFSHAVQHALEDRGSTHQMSRGS